MLDFVSNIVLICQLFSLWKVSADKWNKLEFNQNFFFFSIDIAPENTVNEQKWGVILHTEQNVWESEAMVRKSTTVVTKT